MGLRPTYFRSFVKLNVRRMLCELLSQSRIQESSFALAALAASTGLSCSLVFLVLANECLPGQCELWSWIKPANLIHFFYFINKIF